MINFAFFIYVILILLITHAFADSDDFDFCLRRITKLPDISSCVGKQALQALHNLDNSDNFTLTTGLLFKRTHEKQGREILNYLDHDPTDFRGILENAGAILSDKTMEWDISKVYPGLTMRINSAPGSSGVLEFVMDSYKDRSTYVTGASTARILTKQFVLPFLLGIKFHIATLLPLLIALIIFITKKAAFLGKIALFISGLTGLSGLGGFLSPGLLNSGNHHHYNHHSGYGGSSDFFHNNLSNGYYKNLNPIRQTPEESADKFYDYEKKVHPENTAIYERGFDYETSHSNHFITG